MDEGKSNLQVKDGHTREWGRGGGGGGLLQDQGNHMWDQGGGGGGRCLLQTNDGHTSQNTTTSDTHVRCKAMLIMS